MAWVWNLGRLPSSQQSSTSTEWNWYSAFSYTMFIYSPGMTIDYQQWQSIISAISCSICAAWPQSIQGNGLIDFQGNDKAPISPPRVTARQVRGQQPRWPRHAAIERQPELLVAGTLVQRLATMIFVFAVSCCLLFLAVSCCFSFMITAVAWLLRSLTV